jgi:hypothetical protein
MNKYDLRMLVKRLGNEFYAAFSQNQLSRKDGVFFDGKTPDGAPFIVERNGANASFLRTWLDGSLDLFDVPYGDLAVTVAEVVGQK